jgi:MerR family copper efflux transcriptional regulator
MNISELALRANIKAHTIRFYEKEGLLPQRCVRRRQNNYRDYCEDAVERLLQIREGQLAGFTVAELKELISTEDADPVPAERQSMFIRRKIEAITSQIGRIERFRAYLVDKLALLGEKSAAISGR